MLQDMEVPPPKSMLEKQGEAVPIATKDTLFLEKLRIRAELNDLYDALVHLRVGSELN
jgi:hypothetical protein